MPKLQRRQKHLPETYARWREQIAPYHKFNFRNTKNFTRHQKSSITRAYKKYKKLSEHVANNKSVFVQVKNKNKLRAIKKYIGHAITTNKGFFYYGTNIKKVIVRGRGKKISITVLKSPKRAGKKILYQEIYFPVYPNFDTIDELIDWGFDPDRNNFIIQPDNVRVAYNGYSANAAWNKYDWENSYIFTLRTLEQEILDDGYETPFDGAFFIWHF